MKIYITRHAHDRMVLLGISESQVETAIKRGSKYNQTEGVLAVYSYVCVAYKISNSMYIVKTVFIK